MGTSQLAHTDATPADDTPKRWIRSWTGTAVGGVLALGFLWLAFRTVDWHSAGDLLRTGGLPLLALVLLAYLPSMLVDTLGWSRLLVLLGQPARLGPLLATRLTAEGLRTSLPGGTVLAESLTPAILRTRCGTPLPDGMASLAVRKSLLGLAHGAFLLTAAFVGGPLFEAAARMASAPWLRSSLLTAAYVILALSITSTLLLAGAGSGAAIWRGLHRLPIPPLRRYLEKRQAGFGRFDQGAARLLRSPEAWGTLALFALVWLAESAETWLLLNLLGAPVRFTQALPIEAAASILRQSGIVVPAGLGVQEVGYVLLIAATGTPHAAPLAAAFAVAKRLKEAFWTAAGYLLLARGRRRG